MYGGAEGVVVSLTENYRREEFASAKPLGVRTLCTAPVIKLRPDLGIPRAKYRTVNAGRPPVRRLTAHSPESRVKFAGTIITIFGEEGGRGGRGSRKIVGCKNEAGTPP